MDEAAPERRWLEVGAGMGGLTGCWSLLSLSLSWQFLCHLNCCCRLSSLICWLHLAVCSLFYFPSTPPPPTPQACQLSFFLFARFQHMLPPLWCPLKRIPSEQLLLSLVCFLFLLFPLARKMIPTYNCFCCTPHALAATPVPPHSSLRPAVRTIRAALKSFVRIYANERQFLPFVCNDVAKRGQQGR